MVAARIIEQRTQIPGSRSRAILERKLSAVSNAVAPAFPIAVAEARGATLTDVDGNVFLDLTGGVGSLNVGHAHPRVVAAAQEQLARFAHTVFTEVPYESYVDLAERLVELVPVRRPTKAAFFNTGAEAIENAIKFARWHTGRPAVIAFEGAFHGRTLLAMTMTSKPSVKAGHGPLAPEVYRVPFPNEYHGIDARAALKALERAFVTQVAPDHVAAIAIEAVQGEGGVVVAPREFLAEVRSICDEHGIVLIVDEVQSGFGRTGTMFAIEQYGIEPDVMTLAKSIAAGLPLSAVVGRSEILDAPPDTAIGGTYVGNPVALAAGLAVLDVIADEGLVARARTLGDTIRKRMERWQDQFDAIGDVRGLGSMLAIELVHDRATREPAPELADRVVDEAFKCGVLLLKAGIHWNCIRVLAPLVITDAELDEALGIWERALESTFGT